MPRHNEDPVLTQSRNEALLIIGFYTIAMIYVGIVCYWLGYHKQAADLQPILGMPRWVFWGIAVPWLVCDLFTAWFTIFYMTDQQMFDEDTDEFADAEGESSHGR
jgi:hypothetical protein